MLIAERFLSHIVKEYGQHPVSTDDGGTLVSTTGLSVSEIETSYSFFL